MTTSQTEACDVDGCNRSRLKNGHPWCNTHYHRWYRTGEVGGAEIREFRTGCDVPGCEGRHWSRGYCSRHYRKFLAYGDPLGGAPPRVGENNPAWAGEFPVYPYEAAHKRVRRARGRASEYSCTHCDDRAYDWAYDHADPDEGRTEDGRTYSLNPERYIPLCRPCHRKMDGANRRSELQT